MSHEAVDISILVDDKKYVCRRYLQKRCILALEFCVFSHPTGEAFTLMKYEIMLTEYGKETDVGGYTERVHS